MNRRVDIWEDIKCYQDTLSYALSKVDYSIGEGVYMLPSNMKLNIRSETTGYNSETLVSDTEFSLGRNDMVSARKVKSKDTYHSEACPQRSLVKTHFSQQSGTRTQRGKGHFRTPSAFFGIWYAFW